MLSRLKFDLSQINTGNEYPVEYDLSHDDVQTIEEQVK